MPNWKKLLVSGSDASLNSLNVTTNVTAQSFTGSLFGTSSYSSRALSSSYALTSSNISPAITNDADIRVITANGNGTLNGEVNLTFNGSLLNVVGNLLISGSAAMGTGSLGPSENTITLGARDSANEGGQIGFNAPGGTYTSASFIDNWQNKHRILRGNNTTSDATIANWDLHTKQMQLPAYNSTTAFNATTLVGFLGFDSNGNILTAQTSSVTLTGGATNYLARWASSTSLTTGSVYDTGTNIGIGNTTPAYKLDVSGDVRATGAMIANANGTMYFRGGDDAELWDINVANTLGVYGQQDSTVGSIKLGSNGGIISGRAGNIGIGTITPTQGTLQVNGNVYATSFTGSLLGTASYAVYAIGAGAANSATSASYALSGSYTNFALTASYALNAGDSIWTGSAGNIYYNGGNVGIGVTNPNEKFVVQGNGARIKIQTAGDPSVYYTFLESNYDASNSFNIVDGGSYKFGSKALVTYNDTYINGYYNVYIATGTVTNNSASNIRLFVDQNGNVGIGTTGPSSKLEVYTATGDTKLTVTTTGGNSYVPRLSLDKRGDSAWNISSPAGGFNFAIDQDGTTRLWIASGTGNVGIGTTSPAEKLDVIGKGVFGTLASSRGAYSNGLSVQNNTGEATSLFLWQSGIASAHIGSPANSTSLYIVNSYNTGLITDPNSIVLTNTGLVGIGTTSPTNKLYVSDTVADYVAVIENLGTGTTKNGLWIKSDSAFTDSTILKVTGQSTDQPILQINPDQVRIGPGNIGQFDGILYVTGSAPTVANFVANNSSALFISGSGNVGINTTSPTATLEVNGNVKAISFTGSFSGSITHAVSASYALSSSYALSGSFSNFALTASYALNAADSVWTGSGANIYYNLGNVGIGTTNPSYKLDVNGIGNFSNGFSNPSSETGYRLKFYDNGGIYNDAGIGLDGAGGGGEIMWFNALGGFYWGLGTGGTKMKLDSSGNLGIGTTSPSQKLEVNGGDALIRTAYIGNISAFGTNYASFSHISRTGSGDYSLLSGNDGTTYINAKTSAPIRFRIDNTDKVIIDSSGNVGIGTTNPLSILDVYQAGQPQLRVRGTAGANHLYQDSTTGTATSDGLFVGIGSDQTGYVYHYEANPLVFGTGNAERMRITSGGNIGIGTTNPLARLDVRYDDGVSSGEHNVLASFSRSGTGPLVIGYRADGSSVSSALIRIGDGLPLTIGTTSANQAFTLLNNGNVGIGTASPTQKLDVAGAISVSGSVIDYEVAPALIAPGPAVNIISFVPGTTKAAFVDYVIVDSSGATNQRVGTIMVSISLNTVSAVINEVTTIDIGNTSAITFAVAYGAPTWLTATNSGITPYDINYMVRYF